MSNNSLHLSFVKKLLVDILMGTIFLMLISFALWLIWLTFFRGYFDTGITNDFNGVNFSSEITSSSHSIQRFHNLVHAVNENTELASTCILCHEDLPHFKSKETRTFLNAHGYFMVCEVCHIKQDDNLIVSYRWKDKLTGELSNNYPNISKSKIVPVVTTDGLVKSLEEIKDRAFVMEYLKTNKVSDMKINDDNWDMTHPNMLSNPVSCADCHTNEKTPFISFTDLAYSAPRVEEITTIEVAGMIKKYEHFYLPNLNRKSLNRVDH